MVRVLIGVVDPVQAIGLTAVLDAADDIECLPRPEVLGDIRALLRDLEPDVLLLDASLRRGDPEVVADLVASFPELRVLVWVDHSPEECTVLRLIQERGARLAPEALERLDDCCFTSLRQRAQGCLGAGTAPDAIVRSVRSAAAGEVVATKWLQALTSTLGAAPGAADEARPISSRELEVMSLLAEGLSNKQIARRLGIHEQTVKNHVTKLLAKLGAESRLEAGLLSAGHKIRLSPER